MTRPFFISLSVAFVALVILAAFLLYLQLKASASPAPSTTTENGQQFGGTFPFNNGASGGTGSGNSQVQGGGAATSSIPSTPTPAMYASPTALVTGFYAWYLNGIIQTPNFPYNPGEKSDLSAWLTPDFFTNWESIGENSDADPALLSQGYDEEWLNDFTASTTASEAATSTIRVVLGGKLPTGAHAFSVVTTVTNGQWRIASVREGS